MRKMTIILFSLFMLAGCGDSKITLGVVEQFRSQYSEQKIQSTDIFCGNEIQIGYSLQVTTRDFIVTIIKKNSEENMEGTEKAPIF